MTESRKYFGMTTSQLGILGGLAVAACLVFMLTGWFVFRGGSGFSRTPANTPAPQATSTPFVIPTITPTQTSTPVPYEQLIPTGCPQLRFTGSRKLSVRFETFSHFAQTWITSHKIL